MARPVTTETRMARGSTFSNMSSSAELEASKARVAVEFGGLGRRDAKVAKADLRRLRAIAGRRKEATRGREPLSEAPRAAWWTE
jgi:hypothetical protein